MRIRNWYGRNMTLVNMIEGDEPGGSSLDSFISAIDGGGGDVQSNFPNTDDDKEETDDDTTEEEIEEDADEEGDTGDIDGDDTGDGDTDESADSDTESDPEVDPKDALIEKLMATVEKLTNKPEPEVKAEPEVETDPFKSGAFDDLAKAMNWEDDEKAAMKDFLTLRTDHNNKVVLSQAQNSIPEIVNSTMSAKNKQKAIRETFYTDNPKLDTVKDYVGHVAKTVAAEYKAQGKSIDVQEVLTEAASRAYKALNITKDKVDAKTDNKSGSGKKPAFASSKGARKKASKISMDQQMIGAIMDLSN